MKFLYDDDEYYRTDFIFAVIDQRYFHDRPWKMMYIVDCLTLRMNSAYIFSSVEVGNMVPTQTD